MTTQKINQSSETGFKVLSYILFKTIISSITLFHDQLIFASYMYTVFMNIFKGKNFCLKCKT